MADSRIRKLGWLASLALVAAGGLAACGDEDVTETGTAAAASAEASHGSDVHLYNQAAEIAGSQAQPQAVTEAVGDDAVPNAWEAGNRAVAAALGQG